MTGNKSSPEYEEVKRAIAKYQRVKGIQKATGKLSLKKTEFCRLRHIVNKLKGIDNEESISSALRTLLRRYKKFFLVDERPKIRRKDILKSGLKALNGYHNGDHNDDTLIISFGIYKLILLLEYKYNNGDYKNSKKWVEKEVIRRFEKKLADSKFDDTLDENAVTKKIVVLSHDECYTQEAMGELRKYCDLVIVTNVDVNLNFAWFDREKYGEMVQALRPIEALVSEFFHQHEKLDFAKPTPKPKTEEKGAQNPIYVYSSITS
jgi:hypothetical protein